MEHLSNLELLGQVVGTKTAGKLYRGNLKDLFAVTPHKKLLLAKELVARVLSEEVRDKACLHSSALTRQFLRTFFLSVERELFVVLLLDNQNRVIKHDVLFTGTIDGATVHPREVVKYALRANAAACIFAHNHPSGVAEPSQADIGITRRLKNALGLVDVRTLDHFVIGDGESVSLAERGLI